MSELPDPSSLEALAARASEQALAAGAAQADAYCVAGIDATVRVYQGAVEDLTEAGSSGIGIRAFRDGRVGYAYGSQSDESALEQLAGSAVEAAKLTDPDEYSGLPERCGSSPIADLTSAAFPDWTIDRKVELALSVERAARERDREISNVEDTVYSDSSGVVALANSDGFTGSYASTACYAYAYALAGTGTELMTGLGVGVGREPGSLDAELIGHEAADRALELRGATRPASRRCPVVLDSFVVAGLIAIVGSRLCADSVQRGRSLFAGREGELIAAEAFGLSDDALDPEGLAARPFDDEGVASRRTRLVSGGRLETFLFDSYCARRAGTDSTANAVRGGHRSTPGVGRSNLVIDPGRETLDQLVARAGDGLLVTSVKGLHSGVNPVTGQVSVGAAGRLIEGGRPAGPVREFTIASDLLSLLEGIDGVGSERRWVPFGGSVRAVPLLIGEMAIAGG